MQISFSAANAAGPKSVGAIVISAEGTTLVGRGAAVDALTGGQIARVIAKSGFTGKTGQFIEILSPDNLAANRVLVAGLGEDGVLGTADIELLGAAIVGRLQSFEKSITLALDWPKKAKLSEAEFAAHLALGLRLRSYRFDRYRSSAKEDAPKLTAASIAVKDISAAKKKWASRDAIAQGMFLARDLVNEPANVLTPVEFARRAKELSSLGVKVEILGVPEMTKLGMRALLGVAQGSAEPPRLAVMQWHGGKAKSAPVCFVGKGVCFDSGGLSLKSPASMMGMKGDMGGAAAVTGLMKALALRKAKANVVGVVGLVENMPDGKAQRPNDIVKAMSGTTIEVLNTDAEGRLVLADALWYAQSRFKPKYMIDLATLTGAILVALGTEHAGLFSNDDILSERIVQAGRAEGEIVWRLPLGEAYDKLIKSKIADIKNIGGPNGGSITAAQFLQRFVNNVPWAHLDIAGVAWQDGEHKPLAPSWGTGWGVRVLNRLVMEEE